MQDDLIRLLVCSLACWRISASIYYGKEFRWLRNIAETYAVDDKGECVTWLGRQLSCFWCVSFWTSILISPFFFSYQGWMFLVPFALSAACILLSGGGRTIWRAGNGKQ